MKTNATKPTFDTRNFRRQLRLFAFAACQSALLALAQTKDAPASAAAAAGSIRYEAQPTGSKVKITGDSSMHEWSMESAVISGFIEADANFPESALTSPAAAKPTIDVIIRVRTFKSGKAAMDTKMQESMDAVKFPTIGYKLIELKPKSAPGATGALQFEASGVLMIIGNPVTNTMPVTIEKKDGKLKVTGTTAVKMTDHKLKPPAITLAGVDLITVHDDLKINYEWQLAPKATPAPPAAK